MSVCLTYLWDINMTFSVFWCFSWGWWCNFYMYGSGSHRVGLDVRSFSDASFPPYAVSQLFLWHLCLCVYVCFWAGLIAWISLHIFSFVFSHGFVWSERCIWMHCGSWRLPVSLWPRGDSRLQCAVNLCEVCSCLHVHELIQIPSCVQRLMRWMLLNVFVLNAHDLRHTIGIGVC